MGQKKKKKKRKKQNKTKRKDPKKKGEEITLQNTNLNKNLSTESCVKITKME